MCRALCHREVTGFSPFYVRFSPSFIVRSPMLRDFIGLSLGLCDPCLAVPGVPCKSSPPVSSCSRDRFSFERIVPKDTLSGDPFRP